MNLSAGFVPFRLRKKGPEIFLKTTYKKRFIGPFKTVLAVTADEKVRFEDLIEGATYGTLLEIYGEKRAVSFGIILGLIEKFPDTNSKNPPFAAPKKTIFLAKGLDGTIGLAELQVIMHPKLRKNVFCIADIEKLAGMSIYPPIGPNDQVLMGS